MHACLMHAYRRLSSCTLLFRTIFHEVVEVVLIPSHEMVNALFANYFFFALRIISFSPTSDTVGIRRGWERLQAIGIRQS